MTQVELLSVEKFVHYWPMIGRQLDFVPHMWALWWTKESLYEGVCAERFQCWGVGTANTITAVMFSQVALYPANSVLQVILAFGEGLTDAVDEVEAALERYCKVRGVDVCEITGRPGWEPLLRKKGFGRKSVVMSKRLDIGRLQ
jgi:hypothetical protein